MKKLTLEQRHQVYKLALKNLGRSTMFICTAIRFAVVTLHEKPYCNYKITSLIKCCAPEFLKYKPKEIEVGVMWWPAHERERREKILKELIKLTKPVRK